MIKIINVILKNGQNSTFFWKLSFILQIISERRIEKYLFILLTNHFITLKNKCRPHSKKKFEGKDLTP